MAKDPGIGYRVLATATGVKGRCNAGHQEGDTFELSCHNPDGLCGFFPHINRTDRNLSGVYLSS